MHGREFVTAVGDSKKGIDDTERGEEGKSYCCVYSKFNDVPSAASFEAGSSDWYAQFMTKISPAAINFVVLATTNECVTLMPLVSTVKSPADSSSVLTPGPGKHNISWAQPFPPKIIDGGGDVVWSLQKEQSRRSDTKMSSRHGLLVSSLEGSVGSTKETISPLEKARIAANELCGVTLCLTRHTERPAHPSTS